MDESLAGSELAGEVAGARICPLEAQSCEEDILLGPHQGQTHMLDDTKGMVWEEKTIVGVEQ